MPQYRSPRVKPKIRIFATGDPLRPWLFKIFWPRNHWINSHWWTFEDALDEVCRRLRKERT